MIKKVLINKWLLAGLALVIAAPTWADTVTYYGGFEDMPGAGSDYDYNDVVFSISGSNLMLNQSGGVWSNEPALGTTRPPFWNNASQDGPKFNIGYCIYGSGACGSGLDKTASYLAATTPTGGPVDSVYFSVTGDVSSTVSFHVADDTDVLGWYLLGDLTPTIHYLNSETETGTFTFNPGGSFVLVGTNANTQQSFYSDVGSAPGGTNDPFGSHFAFFGNASDPSVPEPGSMVLMGTALLGVSLLLRRRNRQNPSE
jgi:hypothetical protein